MDTPTVKCPHCHASMKPQRRHGVELDVCPACRGVWLDRGELDEILNRSSRFTEVKADDHPPGWSHEEQKALWKQGFRW